MSIVQRRTFGALPKALPSELTSRIPGMTMKDAGILALFATILGDIAVRYDDYVISIIDRHIAGTYRVAPKQRKIHSA